MTAQKLTLRQQRFLTAYLESGNASAAYALAYGKAGSHRYLAAGAHKVLQQRNVAQRVAQHRTQLEARAAHAAEAWGITAERLVEEYARIALFDIGAVAQWNETGALVLANSTSLGAAQRTAIPSV